MGWVCEFCSTTNEDDNKECFVCGHSKTIDYEAIEREREKKFNNFDILISNIIFGIVKDLFVITASLAFICIIIYLIICILRGNLNHIGTYFVISFNRINNRLITNNAFIVFCLTIIQCVSNKCIQLADYFDVAILRGNYNISLLKSYIPLLSSLLATKIFLKLEYFNSFVCKLSSQIFHKYLWIETYFRMISDRILK